MMTEDPAKVTHPAPRPRFFPIAAIALAMLSFATASLFAFRHLLRLPLAALATLATVLLAGWPIAELASRRAPGGSGAAPDRIVVARLTEQMAFAERLRAMVFKPARWLDRVVEGRRERLVRANLAGPLLLRIPMSSGWHSRFGGGRSIDRFAIEGSDRPFEVRFAEIEMRPSASLAGPSNLGTRP